MIWIFFGFSPEEAAGIMRGAVLPLAARFGIEHEHNLITTVGPLIDITRPGDLEGRALQIPAFDVLRKEGKLETLIADLSRALGIAVYTSEAPLLAAFGGNLL